MRALLGRVLSSQTLSDKKVWTKIFEIGRSDMNVHTYISGISRGVLRKNPTKIIANSVLCRKKWGDFTPESLPSIE